MMNSEINTVMDKIIPILSEKQQYIKEMYSSTKLLEECMQNDDRQSSKEILKQRAVAMERAIECDKKIHTILKNQKAIKINAFMPLLKGDFKKSSYAEDARFKDVIERVSLMREFWLKIVEIDKKMSTRIMGKSSFYNQK